MDADSLPRNAQADHPQETGATSRRQPGMGTRPKPSDINLSLKRAVPFLGTFKRTESEITAALYVAACIEAGDAWQPIGPEAVIETALRLANDGVSWASFAIQCSRVTATDLVLNGFFTAGPDGISPTDLFFAQLEGWVVR